MDFDLLERQLMNSITKWVVWLQTNGDGYNNYATYVFFGVWAIILVFLVLMKYRR